MAEKPAFLWGAASAAYQVEGGWDQGGRGLSKWDVYTNEWHITLPTTGKVETANVSINAYDRDQYLKDIALMRDLGLNAYRFSTSWPRILPEGTGKVNKVGIDYYSRLVDDLLAAGIKPLVTLYHWDFPWVLQEKGGFHNRDVVGWFADYAATVFAALGDRVDTFITMNEPFIDLFLMDLIAENVRHRKEPVRFTTEQFRRQVPALHNLFLASAAGVGAYRASGKKGMVGIAVPLAPTSPLDPDSKADIAAARSWDLLFNRWPLDAAIKGIVADDVMAVLHELDPAFSVSDADRKALAANTVDFVGVNFYSPCFVRHNDAYPLGAEANINTDAVQAFNGPVRPDALHAISHAPARRIRRSAHLHHRERRRLRPEGRGDGRRHGQGSAPRRLHRPPYRGDAARPPRRRRRARLHGVVPLRQFRMVPRLRHALRHGPRRFRHPEAHAQAEFPHLPRHHRAQPGGGDLGNAHAGRPAVAPAAVYR